MSRSLRAETIQINLPINKNEPGFDNDSNYDVIDGTAEELKESYKLQKIEH